MRSRVRAVSSTGCPPLDDGGDDLGREKAQPGKAGEMATSRRVGDALAGAELLPRRPATSDEIDKALVALRWLLA